MKIGPFRASIYFETRFEIHSLRIQFSMESKKFRAFKRRIREFHKQNETMPDSGQD